MMNTQGNTSTKTIKVHAKIKMEDNAQTDWRRKDKDKT